MGLLYYLFSVHHWGLSDLKALWEGETGWHDLIFALSSYEVEQRAEALRHRRRSGGKPADKKALFKKELLVIDE